MADDAAGWPDDERRRIPAPEGWEAVLIGGRRAGSVGYRAGSGPTALWMERTWRSPRGKKLHAVLAVAGLLLAAGGLAGYMQWDWRPTGPSRSYSYLEKRVVSRPQPSLSGAGVVFMVLGTMGFYISLARALNRTRIDVGEGRLVVKHGPVPWRGVRELRRADIEQIYCEDVVRLKTYSVLLRARGKSKPLLVCEDLPTWKEALFVERRLEQALGIADRRVDGEILEKRITSD